MKRKVLLPATLGLFCTLPVWCQNQPAGNEKVPIYSVTVVERTIKAVDYQYRSGPTAIDFRGTVLLPHAKGGATVESKAGRTEVDANFNHLEAPTRFGAEYLTYVLWAITPEGHPKNLGEVLPGSSDHAHLHVTTDLQAFGLMVTAEPYSAVRQPSDVVVMENEIRPDTYGHIEQVQARYELLPRGHYTYNVPAAFAQAEAQGERLPMDRYESLLEVYQAQNAVQIARAMGADRYAPETFGKAEDLLRRAQEFQMRKVDRSTTVTVARQAAQTAEDARAIAVKRKQDEELAQARQQASQEAELRAQAVAEAQQARSQASADRMQLDQERVARQQAEARVAAAQVIPSQPPQTTIATTVPAPNPASSQATQTAQAQTAIQRDLRVRLLQECGAAMPTLDSPRGLVVTVKGAEFQGIAPSSRAASELARIATLVSSYPGLYVSVEGHTDPSGSESRDQEVSYERAAAVRDVLVRSGLARSLVSVRSEGSSRPLVSNASGEGRIENRRVEIVISGDPIGSVPYWDRTYTLNPRR